MRIDYRNRDVELLVELVKHYKPLEKFTTKEAKKRGVNVNQALMLSLRLGGLLKRERKPGDYVGSSHEGLVNVYWIPMEVHAKVVQHEGLEVEVPRDAGKD